MIRRMTVLGMAAVLGFLFGFSNFSYAQEKELVAYWGFDEGKGSITRDSSGNIAPARIEGASWQKGKIGKALLFDGNDLVDCGTDARLNITGDLTIEFWMKPFHLDGWQGLVSKTTDHGDGYSIHLRNSGRCIQLWYAYGNKGAISNCKITENAWHHIVMVVNREKETMCAYVNGIKIPAKPYPGKQKDEWTIDITGVTTGSTLQIPLRIGVVYKFWSDWDYGASGQANA